jgi:hypothetical protein
MGQNKGKRPMSHREKMENIKRQAEEKRLQNKAMSHNLSASQDGELARRKVIFMPYSAAMWDCMETIWRAAKEDPSCEVYVVPIPYLEKDSTGKVNRESYDGEKFPADVPITSYQHFSMERERPDIVYIHNPYDEGNYITGVHPVYYSSNLKRYTRILVYIPYFSGSSIPESHLLLPVYKHMDYMVVFSEQMKEQLKETVPENKILVAAGSPKDERMRWLEEHRDEITLPDTWRERIGNKIVVFLNTSISSILTSGIRSIKKMEEVFRSFSGQSNAILIWRPHPLMRATLISMRPNLLERYDRLEAEFIDQKIGILDKTADANVTVAISDAYMGEPSSSIVNLFRAVGKPIFYTGIYPFYHWTAEERCSVSFRDAWREGNHIWFVTEQNAMLCRMNLSDGRITILGSIADEQPGSTGRYSEITKIDSKIYLMPNLASGICVYDLETVHFRKYYMKDSRPMGFHHMITHDRYLFLTPWQYPVLVRFDTVQKEFAYYGTELDWTKYADPFWTDAESLLLLHRDGRGLLRFLLTTCEIQILPGIDDTIPREAVKWIEAVHAFNPDQFPIFENTNKAVHESNSDSDAVKTVYASDSDAVKTIHASVDSSDAITVTFPRDNIRFIDGRKSREQTAYAGYLIGDNKVLVFPRQYGDIKEWNASDGTVTASSLNHNLPEYQKKQYYDTGVDFTFVKPYNRKDTNYGSTEQSESRLSDEAWDGGFLAFSTLREDSLYYRESEKAPIRKIPCRLSEEDMAIKYNLLGEKEWTESDEVSVELFLSYLKYRKSKPQPTSPVIGTTKGAGQEIHEMILKCL